MEKVEIMINRLNNKWNESIWNQKKSNEFIHSSNSFWNVLVVSKLNSSTLKITINWRTQCLFIKTKPKTAKNNDLRECSLQWRMS